jgi:Zn-dependent protease with chaperone function
MKAQVIGVFALAACTGAAIAAGAQDARIVTPIDGRNGPGAYYDAGVRLLRGAAVKVTERRGAWVKAEVEPQRAAWIPAYALDTEQQRTSQAGAVLRSVSKSLLRSLSSMIDRRDRPKYLTRTAVTLGVRGFSGAYSAHRGMKAGEVDPALWETPAFDAAAYQAFVGERFEGRDWESLKRRLPLDPPAPVADPEADKLGAALTAFVARQDGLVRNAPVEMYLSQIATLVAESSHAYDLPVRVYILDSAQPKGFVSPNGIVFVSSGALARMQSEAEFAFFVGHEIAHIAFQHGLRKIGRDEARVREGDAFAEMESDLAWDERTDDKYVRTNAELSELADQIHEYFARENNDRDELEADYWGLIYAARAGYVPEAAESLLLRMVAGGKPGDGTLLWNGVARDKRLDGCRAGSARIKLDRKELRSFESEFGAGKQKAAGT